MHVAAHIERTTRTHMLLQDDGSTLKRENCSTESCIVGYRGANVTRRVQADDEPTSSWIRTVVACSWRLNSLLNQCLTPHPASLSY